jgi:hypothetical protein
LRWFVQDALAKREKEKAMMDAARRKEQEMLDRIADAEMRRALREEEERKRDEEERLAQERYEVGDNKGFFCFVFFFLWVGCYGTDDLFF